MSTRNTKITGTVAEEAGTPRSLVVTTSTGTLRRNRTHLTAQPEAQPQSESEQEKHPPTSASSQEPQRNPIMTRSRTGTIVGPPERLYH